MLEQDVETPVQVHPPKHDYPEHVRKQSVPSIVDDKQEWETRQARYNNCCRSIWSKDSISSAHMEAR